MDNIKTSKDTIKRKFNFQIAENKIVTFKIKQESNEKIYFLHYDITIYWSNVWFNLLDSNKSKELIIEFEEKFEEFELLISFLYPPNEIEINLKNIEIILRLSDKYEMLELLEKMKSKLSTFQPSLELFVLAEIYEVEKDKKRCIPWIIDNYESCQNNSQWIIVGNQSKDMFSKILNERYKALLKIIHTHSQHMCDRNCPTNLINNLNSIKNILS